MASAIYETALRSASRKPIYKIEWMNSDEQVIDEVISELISGSVSVELKNGIRRSCNIQFSNEDGKYLPDKDGLVYLNKKFKLYTGLQINGVNYFNSQGIFNCGNPVVRGRFSERTVQIEGYDNFILLNGNMAGELADDYIIPVGTTVTDAVTAIFTAAGIIKAPIIYPNSAVFPYTVMETSGSNYFNLLDKIAGVMSYDIFFDVEGRPRFRPPTDEQESAPVWEFGVSEPTYLGGDHNYNFLGVKNYIKVYGDNVNGDLYAGVAQDTGIFSPTSINRIGQRTKVISDSLIYSDALCVDRAEYELKKTVQVYENFDMKCIPVDFIKEGDIVLVDDPQNGFNRDNCLVKNLDIPLSYNSEQTMGLWKVRDI